jgi:5-methylcytosine-specific restriction endonuclease McrA
MRHCSRCGRDESTVKVYSNNWCAICTKEYKDKHRDRIKETNAAYWAANKEALLPKVRIAARESQLRRPEEYAAYLRQYNQDNAERLHAYHTEYNRQHPDLVKEAGHRYRTRKRGGEVVPYKRQDIIDRDKQICQICFAPEVVPLDDLHIDHIVQIADGGSDAPDNVRVAHSLCNLSRPKGPRRSVASES